jgi:hypothetical protein
MAMLPRGLGETSGNNSYLYLASREVGSTAGRSRTVGCWKLGETFCGTRSPVRSVGLRSYGTRSSLRSNYHCVLVGCIGLEPQTAGASHVLAWPDPCGLSTRSACRSQDPSSPRFPVWPFRHVDLKACSATIRSKRAVSLRSSRGSFVSSTSCPRTAYTSCATSTRQSRV